MVGSTKIFFDRVVSEWRMCALCEDILPLNPFTFQSLMALVLGWVRPEFARFQLDGDSDDDIDLGTSCEMLQC